MKTKIAIVGAGLSGLTAANYLSQEKNIQVTLFEKSRGVGGRMATRRAQPYDFDFGAQYFTARSDAFKQFIKPFIDKGILQIWEPLFVELDGSRQLRKEQWTNKPEHYVPVPQMTALCKEMAKDSQIYLTTKIVKIHRESNVQWTIFDENGPRGSYDWVILAMPVAQARELLPDSFSHCEFLNDINMMGCYSLMLGIDEPWPMDWQVALVHGLDISWISVNSSKPGRSNETCIVVHATNQWAQDNMDLPLEEVKSHLIKQLTSVVGGDLTVKHADIHRWRYANISKVALEHSLVDANLKLGVCGDWCIQGRVEAAFLSGQELATQVIKGIASR